MIRAGDHRNEVLTTLRRTGERARHPSDGGPVDPRVDQSIDFQNPAIRSAATVRPASVVMVFGTLPVAYLAQ